MRLLLSLVGASAMVGVGWICWRATAEGREWREFVALGTKPRTTPAQQDRFLQLGRRLFPKERSLPTGITILGAPEEDRRILVQFFWRGRCGDRGARLAVLDEEGRRRWSGDVNAGPCGFACTARPDRGRWAFDLVKLSPGVEPADPYRLVDDRPVKE